MGLFDNSIDVFGHISYMRRIKIITTLFYRNLSRLLYGRVILILTLLICIGFGTALFGTRILFSNLIDAQAIHYASVSVKIINQARVMYSRNVVNKVKSIEQVKIIPDYHDLKGSIPNPATYTIELGEQLTKGTEGMLFRLYSDYPFPNRHKTGGVKDEFEADALSYLKRYPQKSFYDKEIIQGRLTFRYTEAILMEPSCVNCHNKLPNSPKKNWQVGDVRGVIEINQPLDEIMLTANNGFKIIYTVLAIILTLAITGLVLVVARFRLINQELENKVAKRTQALNLLAITDELTQLGNRRQFETIFQEEWRRAWRLKNYISIILCDIDYFKKYNDTYGHPAGDICLRSVADMLQSNIKRAGELVARYGGEEFIIVLPNVDSTQASLIANRILHQINQMAIPHQSSPLQDHITLSMGIATMIPRENIAREQLIKIADQNLYQAKREGRNRCSVNIVEDFIEEN